MTLMHTIAVYLATLKICCAKTRCPFRVYDSHCHAKL